MKKLVIIVAAAANSKGGEMKKRYTHAWGIVGYGILVLPSIKSTRRETILWLEGKRKVSWKEFRKKEPKVRPTKIVIEYPVD